MTDDVDRARAREEEMRADGMGAIARKLEILASQNSAEICQVCDEPIPVDRQLAWPGVQTCLDCQNDLEHALKGVRRK